MALIAGVVAIVGAVVVLIEVVRSRLRS